VGDGGIVVVAGGIRYAANADGFRDRLYARPKRPGTFRIVVLGDSVAFGWGVPAEDTFPKVLEASLAHLAPGIEVLNLGVTGYNPYTEAALLADVGLAYEHDLVIFQFCVNDLNDQTLHFYASTFAQLPAIPAEAFPEAKGHRVPLPSRAMLVCRASSLCTLLVERMSAPDPAMLAATLATHADPSAEELAWLRTRYADMAAVAARVRARFAVVVFPWRSQVDGRAPAGLADRLTELGRDAGWETIDLLPAFRAATPGVPLFVDIWHPNVAGHRIAADAILAALRCRRLVPVPPGSGCSS
jgi:lysophospholipase L1-like esterase